MTNIFYKSIKYEEKVLPMNSICTFKNDIHKMIDVYNK